MLVSQLFMADSFHPQVWHPSKMATQLPVGTWGNRPTQASIIQALDLGVVTGFHVGAKNHTHPGRVLSATEPSLQPLEGVLSVRFLQEPAVCTAHAQARGSRPHHCAGL